MTRYFLYTPDAVQWFPTEALWRETVEGYDFLGNHCDDGWDWDVDQCLAGIVPEGFILDEEDPAGQLEQYALYVVEQFNLVNRPDDSEIDEDGHDKDGNYWSEDWAYRCRYRFSLKSELEATAAA
jgi:hypothetical protein